MQNKSDSNLTIPAPLYKSPAIALLFSAFLGPIGLLYASFWGGITMILVAIIVISHKYLIPILLLWPISCVWSMSAVEKHNTRLWKMMRQIL
jgi:hypothetical protein